MKRLRLALSSRAELVDTSVRVCQENRRLTGELADAWQLIADLRADLEDVSADLRASQAINQELMAWCPSDLRELEP